MNRSKTLRSPSDIEFERRLDEQQRHDFALYKEGFERGLYSEAEFKRRLRLLHDEQILARKDRKLFQVSLLLLSKTSTVQ